MKRLALVAVSELAEDFNEGAASNTLVLWEDIASWSEQFWGIRFTYTGENSDRKQGDTLCVPWASIVYYEVSDMSRWSHDS